MWVTLPNLGCDSREREIVLSGGGVGEWVSYLLSPTSIHALLLWMTWIIKFCGVDSGSLDLCSRRSNFS